MCSIRITFRICLKWQIQKSIPEDWFIVVVQSLSHVQCFATPWNIAHQASCPTPSPRVCSNSCPLSPWCYITISSSAASSFCLYSFPTTGSCTVSWLFPSGDQSIGASLSASVLPVNIQNWFPLWLTGLISCSSGDSQESSPTPLSYCHLFLISSASVRFIPFLFFIESIFAWNVPLVSPIFLKTSLVFPFLLFSSISLHWSLRKAFLSPLAILRNSAQDLTKETNH